MKLRGTRLHPVADGSVAAGSRAPALVAAVDRALASLRGRRSVAGTDATAMFERLDEALHSAFADQAEPPGTGDLVSGGLATFRSVPVVPAAVVTDRLLDVRLAATAPVRSSAGSVPAPAS